MYFLWKEKRINKPSEYWNMTSGDKLVTRAFFEKYMDEKSESKKHLKRNKVDVFPVVIV
jgi:hypothetical protein